MNINKIVYLFLQLKLSWHLEVHSLLAALH